MGRLTARFPSFGDVYDVLRMREMVRHLEALFSQVVVDVTRGAYPVTSSMTLGADDDVVLVDTSAGDVTITLPAISDAMVRLKREYEVVKVDAANALTIVPTGGDTVVGEPDALVTVQWTALRFRATPGEWVII
jgi:hypothetical protein